MTDRPPILNTELQPLLYKPDGGSLDFGNSYVSCQWASYKCPVIQLSGEFLNFFISAQGGQPHYYHAHLLTYKHVHKSHSDSYY